LQVPVNFSGVAAAHRKSLLPSRINFLPALQGIDKLDISLNDLLVFVKQTHDGRIVQLRIAGGQLKG